MYVWRVCLRIALGDLGLKRLVTRALSIILLLPRLVTRVLSAEARDFSISALGIFISALSRSVSALNDLGLKRGKKRNVVFSHK